MGEVLAHHGVLGQKWGVRRYQNKDGSLTSLGKKHVNQINAAAKKQDAATKKQAEINALKSRDNYNKEGYAITRAAQKQDAAIYGYGISGGGSDREADDDEIKKKKRQLQAIEEALVKEFGEKESLKYVKTNRNEDISKTTFTYISPIDGSKSTYSLTTAGSIISRLKNDLNTVAKAKQRTEAGQKQDTARKKQETVVKKEKLKEEVDRLVQDSKTLAELTKKYGLKSTGKNGSDNITTTMTAKQKMQYEAAKQRKSEAAQKKFEEEAEFNRQLSDKKKKLRHAEEVINIDNILVHYGVLGMKWGIRKDANKAYEKASKKLRKLDKKLTSRNAEKDRRYEQSLKADVISRKRGLFTSEEKIAKREEKSIKASNKYSKANYKAEKAYNKASKWYKKMEKAFANVELTNVSKSDLDLGAKYAEMVWNNSHRPSHK